VGGWGTAMSDVSFTRVGTTAFYKPDAPGRGERLWFLRWRTDDSPPGLTLTEMWQAEGTPKAVGYFVFFDVLPPESAAPDVERDLREIWKEAAPTASSFAWVTYTAAKKKTAASGVSVSTRLGLTLNASNRPAVDADTRLALPPRMQTLGFGAGAPVIGVSAPDAKANGFVITYPPLGGAEPPRGGGVLLPITGNAVGCVCFSALVELIDGKRPRDPDPDESWKSLVTVQIDPLHPFDRTRTFEALTGRDYLLRRTLDGFQLLPAPPAGA
jgi:hypothetical protein